MSLVCEAIIAMSFTFFGLCEEAKTHEKVTGFVEDKGVWDVKPPPPPEPEPELPDFPQVIIQYVDREPEPEPIPEPDPEPIPEPETIDFYFLEEPKKKPMRSVLLAARRGEKTESLTTWHASFGGTELKEQQEGVAFMDEGDVTSSSFSFPQQLNKESVAFLPAAQSPNYRDYEGKYQSDGLEAGVPINNENIIAGDRYITGIMETGLNSQIAGRAIVQVDNNVFGYHGRNILVPKGSRLICDYGSAEKVGVTRLSLDCSRILYGGNRLEIYGLTSKVADSHGRSGISGDVDNRFWEKYGTALLMTAISAGVQIGSRALDSDENSATSTAGEELSKRFGEITASVLQQSVDIRPVITIAQGTRVNIIPENDWYIRN